MKVERLNIRTAADVRAQNAIPLASRYSERSTYELLQASAAAHADRPALTFLLRGTLDEEPIVYRYREFFARVTQAANAFNRLGLGPGDVVAYLLPNLPQTHFTIWGGETAGRVAAINPLLESSQILQILRAVRARMLVTLAPGAPGLDLWAKCAPIISEVETLEHVLCVDPTSLVAKSPVPRAYPPLGRVAVHDFDALLDREAGLAPRVLAPDRSLRHRQPVPHRRHDRHAEGRAAHAGERGLSRLVRGGHAGHRAGQGILCGLPLFHVNAPLATGLAVWAAGGNVVLATPSGFRTPGLLANLWALLARYRVYAMMAVPTVYASLLDIPRRRL